MAYFPVFMDLHGRAVLVVGGGKVAARKVRALCKAGADVSIIAAGLGQELSGRCDQGEVQWIASDFAPELLAGFWLVFAATDDAGLNRIVFEAGEARSVPVNVVDDKAHCRFISPAVIDREPVQVAVSTGGSSPVLARALRSWIEALLPHGLGKIATAAGELRKRIGRRLSLTERRRNWEFLIDRARIVHWSSQPIEAISHHMQVEFSRRLSNSSTGKVYLVGAGPGRADLLTLRAVEVLQQADLILHDRLVPESILEQARRDAERVDVGKRAGDHHGVQKRIFRLMVEGAKAGKTVVRLKGGDAFVFGRGGEELEHLRANSIEYEVVPGITAALGCAAFAGIPLTHRGYAQQLTLATGHFSRDQNGFDNDAMNPVAAGGVGPGRTMVIYMGVKRAAEVRQSLLEQGISPELPVALIINGTLERQRVLFGTVSTLTSMAAEVPEASPGLFIIGEVSALGERLSWFGGLPEYDIAA